MLKHKLSLLLLMSCSLLAHAQTFPQDFTLNDLSTYINKKVDCETLSCTMITAMSAKSYSANKKELLLNFQISSRTLSTMVLPFSCEQVYIDEATLDNKPWMGLSQEQNQYSVVIPEGSHTLALRLRLKDNLSSLLLSFAPPNFINEDKASTINLVKRNDTFMLEFSELAAMKTKNNTVSINQPSVQSPSVEKNNALPLATYYMVSRELLLQDKWKLKTTVSLLPGTDITKAKSIKIKLLPGESILTENILPTDGAITVYPQSSNIVWESILEKSPDLTLNTSNDYIQTWKIESEKDWFFNYSGLTPYEQTAKGYSWIFFPHDSLNLKFEKPAVQTGRSLNVTNLLINVLDDKAKVKFNMNSSLGGRTYVEIPKDVKVTNFMVNDNTIGVPQDEKKLALDLKRGENNISLILSLEKDNWKESLPKLKFDEGVVNTTYSYNNNELNRWILAAGGADINPPIQMWGIILAIIFFSYFLSKSKVPMSIISWSILLFGFIQFSFIATLLIIITLIMFSLKEYVALSLKDIDIYNGLQKLLIVLAGLSALVILATLFNSLSGNEGIFVPKNLLWFNEQMPKNTHAPWLISVPIWMYRATMFIWAGWLAWRLVLLGKWGWQTYLKGGVRKTPPVVQSPQS